MYTIWMHRLVTPVVVAVIVGVLMAGAGCQPVVDAPPAPIQSQAWTSLCAGLDVHSCVDDGPLQCTAGVPRAACESCGCAGGDACVDGPAVADSVCASAAVQNAVRADARISDGLADDDYLAIYTVLDGADVVPLTLAAMVGQLRSDARADARRQLVVVGRDAAEGGVDAANVVVDAIADGTDSIGVGDGSCAALATAASALTVNTVVQDAALRAVVGPVDNSTQALCAFPGSVARCVLPHRQSCLDRGGAVAPAVVVVDDDVFLARLDDALLRSVARVGRSTWEQRLDSIVVTFQSLLLSRQPEARFAIDGRDREVRVVRLPSLPPFATDAVDEVNQAAPVYLAWLPRFGVRPARSLTFRLLWQDGPTRQFLTDHDLVPADCAFDIDANAAVDVVCTATDGAVVSASVDLTRNVIIASESTVSPP
jgi:hypothetical protein